MRLPVKLEFDLPARISSYKLDETKRDTFNNGEFERTNYKRLYVLMIDKGKGKTYIQVASPSLKQILYSLRVLWNAYDGKPYDRHNHPVVMQAYDIEEMPLEVFNKLPKARKKVVRNFQRAYTKHKSKP